MSKYERRMFFEALCLLRQRYATRDAADASSCISIADAMALANGLLDLAPRAASPETDSVQADAEPR